MATFIQIPKTMSSPKDPGAPSFLTTLRPEIRNAVYAMLFRHDAPVLLHNWEAYYPKPLTPQPGRPIDPESWRYFDECVEKAIGGHSEFTHDFQISLLLSCRQIYHEGVGILYGQNTFVFSRALHRHDWEFAYAGAFKDIEYHPLEYAPKWLTGIGSQFALIREISIDTDALCPPGCEHGRAWFALLPLARFFWKHPTSSCCITARSTGRISPVHMKQYKPTAFTDQEVHVFQRIINMIVKEDALNIKRFAYSDRLLKHISITQNLEDIVVMYKSTTAYGKETSMNFKISNLMGAVRINKIDHPTNGFLNLPRTLRSQILELTCFSPDGVIFDLDAQIIHGFDLKCLHTSRLMRFSMNYLQVPHSIDLTIKMTSDKVISNFDHFRIFEGLVQSRPMVTNLFQTIIFGGLKDHPATTIALNFKVASKTTLNQIRINITGLFQVLRYSSCSEMAKIRITLSCPNNNELDKEKSTISVADIQKSAFLLVSDVIAHLDHKGFGAYGAGVPEIWITGQGTLLKASYLVPKSSPRFSIDYAHKSLNKTEVHLRGYRMINLARSNPSSFSQTTGAHNAQPLLDIWHSLRRLGWPDYELETD
jgi:hypothetical protein